MIDTHLHLDDQVFDGKVDQIIAEMKACGVEFVINNSYDLNSMRSSVELAHKYKEVYATVGMHPHDAQHFDDGFIAEMDSLRRRPEGCCRRGKSAWTTTTTNQSATYNEMYLPHKSSLPTS